MKSKGLIIILILIITISTSLFTLMISKYTSNETSMNKILKSTVPMVLRTLKIIKKINIIIFRKYKSKKVIF